MYLSTQVTGIYWRGGAGICNWNGTTEARYFNWDILL